MSDIAKKTLPSGKLAGSKGGSKTAESSEPAAPRSVTTASLPKEDLSEPERDDESQEVNYTHQRESSLPGVAEEGEGPIKMSDDAQESTGDVETEKRVSEASEKGAADAAPNEAKDVQDDVEDKGADTKTPAETTSTQTSLTEKAKEAFDQASENQPTSEARESFIQSAKDNLETASGVTGIAGNKSEQKQSEAQGSEKSAKEAAEEHVPDDLHKSPSEAAGKPTSASGEQQAPSELQEMAPQAMSQEGGSQEPADWEKAAASAARSQYGSGGSPQPRSAAAGSQAGEDGEGQGIQADTQVDQQFNEEQEPAPEQQEGSQAPPSEAPASEARGSEAQYTQGSGSQAPGSQAPGSQAPPESETVAEHLDFSVLKGGKVNKGGNIVNNDGKVVGRVTSGILQYLVGKKVDENGEIWSDNGKVIGNAEPITDSEREDMMREPSPFESFPDATVDGNGMVVSNGEWVGKVTVGDVSVLRGKQVDADGDILDKGGNVIGHAERWEPEPEPEAEPEPEVDRSILAGKRVNKAGNVVDSSGNIYGRVVEGDVKKMVGRMCDKNGNILSESGDILGKADVVPEGEREGLKEGPFAELEGCTVAKDGTIVTPAGDIVGRLTQGDGKTLFGRPVDEDGDVLDRNGNVIGKAERWVPEEVERKKNPMTGRKVNREGNVVDEDGNVVGKLTSGDLNKCSGKEIDDDGDVVDYKGTVVGHCSLLEDIPVEEETEEQKQLKERTEQDRKLAAQMSVCIEQCLDKIKPICSMITDVSLSHTQTRTYIECQTDPTATQKINQAERTPEDERDEEALVQAVRPLIEEGGRILNEAKGVVKGLDPDGRIAANAKHKTAAREATPEEYHLADVLKELTGSVTECIEDAKRKLEGMPHAKKELNPLWGLLSEPLFQILAAVGLLLAGVLGLVGRLVSNLPTSLLILPFWSC